MTAVSGGGKYRTIPLFNMRIGRNQKKKRKVEWQVQVKTGERRSGSLLVVVCCGRLPIWMLHFHTQKKKKAERTNTIS
jgi:hypothetical protein